MKKYTQETIRNLLREKRGKRGEAGFTSQRRAAVEIGINYLTLQGFESGSNLGTRSLSLIRVWLEKKS